jgi:PDZ domain-containing protein
MRRGTRIFVAIAFVVVGMGGWVRLPYYAVGPGPAQEVEPLITIGHHTTYPSAGKLIMTTVSEYKVTPLLALQAWIDPNLELKKQSELFQPGSTQQQEQQRALSEMDQSKIDAAFVVLRKLTSYPKRHGSGALIEGVEAGCPADGRLFSGDLVTAINGTPITSNAEASKVLDGVAPASPLTFRVSAAGQTHEVRLVRTTCDPTVHRPIVGIQMVDSFPFPLSISSGDIGGPSAGLMWALGLYDLLTPGDLTSGRTIAGTGTVGLDGTIGPIGGIQDKVVAAERVGATVFLAPKDNMQDLSGVDTGGMKVVPVGSFEDALRYLQPETSA